MPDSQSILAAAYPEKLAKEESKLVAMRRERAGVSDPSLPAVGLALSGGGIRSATFCLGVLQVLARRHLLRRIDFLSTVSGGGYCGSFLGTMICRPPRENRQGILGAEAELADLDSRIVRWLREHGRYLSPNGAGDEILAFAALLRNWLAVQGVLIAFVAAALSVVVLARVVLEERLGYGAAEGMILWSPFWWLPLVWLIPAIPFGWAYWMVPRVDAKTGRAIGKRPLCQGIGLTIAAFALAALYWWRAATDEGTRLSILFLAIGLFLVSALILLGWFWAREGAKEWRRRDRRVRNKLSAYLAQLLKFTAVSASVALVDSLGETLYAWLSAGGGLGILGRASSLIGVGGGLALVRKLVAFAQRTDGKGRVPLPLGVVAGVAALLAAGIVLVGVSAGVHAVAWEALLWPGPATEQARWCSIVLLLVLGIFVSYLVGGTLRFANDSSHQALYGARLARAYLGASNPPRLAATGEARRVTEPIAGDDLALSEYAPHAAGGPLHLINVTLNETVAGESQIEHRDRKGLALAVGPSGLSAGVRHHACWARDAEGRLVTGGDRIAPVAPKTGYRVFVSVKAPPSEPTGADIKLVTHPPDLFTRPQAVEPLSLATWVAISGAAVAPGLGARTSLGFSLLLTLFNVRLGYWWNSEIDPKKRREACALEKPRVMEKLGEVIAWLFPVQTYLFYELLARFYGPNRQHWYLSDGGHFENTAGYELIRRRVPFIIVCDCGQDPAFDFADVANLVRKARTDFNAEIRFLSEPELKRVLNPALRERFGVPADFSPFAPAAPAPPTTAAPSGSCPAPRPCAMLARVDYDGSGIHGKPGSVILFLKPSLVGDEPEDVLHYAHQHPDYPHESTGDQYFDEAQWESYRMLGEFIAERVFAAAPGGEGWLPSELTLPRLDGR